MSSNKKLSKISAKDCNRAVENFMNSEEYFKNCLEVSGLQEVKCNGDLSKLICAALGIAIRKENVKKIRNIYIRNKV